MVNRTADVVARKACNYVCTYTYVHMHMICMYITNVVSASSSLDTVYRKLLNININLLLPQLCMRTRICTCVYVYTYVRVNI